jgi:uncharacterized cupredoxin-like copper-binding protein
VRRATFLLPIVVILAGCGGGYGSSGGASTQASAGGYVLKTIRISEKEYSLTPNTVSISKAGTYRFKTTNDGHVTHALELEGNGLEAKTRNIDPGSDATLQVTLKAGSYEMYCPVDGHKQEGMKGDVTVAAAGGTGGMTPNEGTTTSSGGGYGS